MDDDCPHGLGMRIACTICLGKLPRARKGGGGRWWPGMDDRASNVVIGFNPVPASGRDLSRVIERDYAPTIDSQRISRRSPTRTEWGERRQVARFTRGAPRAHAIG